MDVELFKRMEIAFLRGTSCIKEQDDANTLVRRLAVYDSNRLVYVSHVTHGSMCDVPASIRNFLEDYAGRLSEEDLKTVQSWLAWASL